MSMIPILEPVLVDPMASMTDRLWTPFDINTGLWLDASRPETVTESLGSVSQIDDVKGNGRNGTQGNGAFQPTYQTAVQNGLNILRLDGATQFLEFGTGMDFMAGGVSHICFTVFKDTNQSNLYGAANGNQGDRSLHVGFRGNGTQYRINRWSNNYYPPITANFNPGQFNLLRWVWPVGQQKSAWANAKLEGQGGLNASTLGTMAGGGRIANVTGSGYIGGDFCEGVWVTSPTANFSQDMIDRIEGYLAWKWGIEVNLPASHPYKNGAPMA